MINFENREEWFKTLNQDLIIAEIGVFKGEFSKFIFETLHPRELHLFDLFEGTMCSADANGNDMVYTQLEHEYELLKTHFKKSPVIFHKGHSADLLHNFPDNYFDVIYIDGDHSYEGVKKDLNISLIKIKNEGYICGHDYEMNHAKTHHNYQFGVKQAVDEFCQHFNQQISIKLMDGCVGFVIKINK